MNDQNREDWKPAGWPKDKPFPAEWDPADEHLIKPIELEFDGVENDQHYAIEQIYGEFVEAHKERQRDAVCCGRNPERVSRESVAEAFYHDAIFDAVDDLENPEVDAVSAWRRVAALYAFALMEKVEVRHAWYAPKTKVDEVVSPGR